MAEVVPIVADPDRRVARALAVLEARRLGLDAERLRLAAEMEELRRALLALGAGWRALAPEFAAAMDETRRLADEQARENLQVQATIEGGDLAAMEALRDRLLVRAAVSADDGQGAPAP